MLPICDSYHKMMWVVFLYIHLWFGDMCEYYYTTLILFLPAYMFGVPVIHIKQFVASDVDCESDSSDSDDEGEEVAFDVFISKLEFVFNDGVSAWIRPMHGLQLAPFVNASGKFFINAIEEHYPSLIKINLQYIKYQDNYESMVTVVRTIDVKQKMDIHNNQSCRLGVVF